MVIFIGVCIIPSGTTLVEGAGEGDVQPPVNIVLYGMLGENEWYLSCVTITFIINVEEVDYIMYKLDDEEWITYTEPFEVCKDGEHTICWYYVYNGGNQSDIECIDFKIDQTDPTINLTIEKIGFRKWLITADVFDETSGVERVEFYFDQELQGAVTEPPYEWIYNSINPVGFSVRGAILNPEFTEETVSFFAVIVRGHVRWHYIYGHPTVNAIVYDYAGNYAISPPISPLFITINHLYIFQQLTFPNDYSGYIGKHFISAVFEDGPY